MNRQPAVPTHTKVNRWPHRSSNPQTRIIIVHQQVRIFLQHALGQALGHLHNGSIVALPPAMRKPRPHGLGTELPEPAASFPIAGELVQQRLLPQSLQVTGLVGVRHIPTPCLVLQEILLQHFAQFGQNLMLSLMKLAQKLGLDLLIGLGLAAQGRVQLLSQPLNGALLVVDEQGELLDLGRLRRARS